MKNPKKLEILTFGEYSRKIGSTPSTTFRDYDIWKRYVEVYSETPEYEAMLKRRKAEEKNPFKNWTSTKADKLLQFTEKLCKNEEDAAAHLASCLMALTTLENAVQMCGFIEQVTKKAEKGAKR